LVDGLVPVRTNSAIIMRSAGPPSDWSRFLSAN